MEEAAVADNVAIIDHGLIVATGTPAALKSRYSADRLYLVANDYEQMRTLLEERGIAYQFSGGQFVIGIGSSLEALPILEDLKGTYTDFQVIAGDMDDVFVGITGREMREDATL
ncbi:MAG TPA: ABC transporter, partial [Bacillota bacterium]|nr:ABC transporter [Bacillota bacterium]